MGLWSCMGALFPLPGAPSLLRSPLSLTLAVPADAEEDGADEEESRGRGEHGGYFGEGESGPAAAVSGGAEIRILRVMLGWFAMPCPCSHSVGTAAVCNPAGLAKAGLDPGAG